MAIKPRPLAIVREEDGEGRSQRSWTCHTEEQISERIEILRNLYAKMPEANSQMRIIVGRLLWEDDEGSFLP